MTTVSCVFRFCPTSAFGDSMPIRLTPPLGELEASQDQIDEMDQNGIDEITSGPGEGKLLSN